MSDEANGHGKSRLDRLHIAFAEEHNKLLTAQVVLNNQLQGIGALQKNLAESQKQTDERMNALLAIVDDMIRKRAQ